MFLGPKSYWPQNASYRMTTKGGAVGALRGPDHAVDSAPLRQQWPLRPLRARRPSGPPPRSRRRPASRQTRCSAARHCRANLDDRRSVIGDTQTSSAAKCGLQINWAVKNIINPALKKVSTVGFAIFAISGPIRAGRQQIAGPRPGYAADMAACPRAPPAPCPPAARCG
jgi:hypothetical protein